VRTGSMSAIYGPSWSHQGSDSDQDLPHVAEHNTVIRPSLLRHPRTVISCTRGCRQPLIFKDGAKFLGPLSPRMRATPKARRGTSALASFPRPRRGELLADRG